MAKARFEKIIDYENKSVTIKDLGSGESLTMFADELVDNSVDEAKLYCINDRVPGAANSKKVTPIVAMTKMWENMKAGVWPKKGGGLAKITDLVAALMEYSKQPQPEVEEKIANMKAADEANGTKDVAALKAHPDLAPILERMKTERQKEREKAAKTAAKGNETPLEF